MEYEEVVVVQKSASNCPNSWEVRAGVRVLPYLRDEDQLLLPALLWSPSNSGMQVGHTVILGKRLSSA